MARQVIVFRNRLRPEVEAAFNRRADGVYELALGMPGFLSSKDFVADDGERLSVIEFESAEQLRAWRDQPEHARAQAEGRSRWFSEYLLQVCELVRESRFSAAPEPEPPAVPVDVGGGCACGAVRYRARGVPRDQTLCHCSDCRRASGAPAVGWMTFDAEQIEWAGAPKERRSSEQAVRGFCAKCGTQLSFRRVALPSEIDLTLGSLDDPNAIAPRDHTYTRSQLSWLRVADGLPRFEAAREDSER
jgi:heme-degrading monooxygenase HmoA